MLHALLHLYNQAPPKAKSAEWAQAQQAQHQRNLQANQPQSHTQQAQAATETVAPKPI